MTSDAPLRLAVICPHLPPDTAPTGEVMGRIIDDLVARGHEVHAVTSLPWYRDHRVEREWDGPLWRRRRERTPWGSVTRVHPFATGDKRNIAGRALGFAAFTGMATLASLPGGRVDAVIAMSPPLTIGLAGWACHLVRRGPLVFNVQDVFPDAAIETGAIRGRSTIALARWLERTTYRRADAITVVGEAMRANVAAKVPGRLVADVHVIPNFVDVDVIRPGDRHTQLRAELGIGDEPVVMYAGNVGFSQSLDLLVHAARQLPDATFVVNGDGSALPSLRAAAANLRNVRFGGFQPRVRLAEVLATGDVHVVPLRAGLGRVSVPSKTLSILAAGRPVVAAIDPGTDVPWMLHESGGGVAVAPDDPDALVGALRVLLADRAQRDAMGVAGRAWVERAAAPAAVAAAYESLVRELMSRRGRRPVRAVDR